ncbi:hypothetical protein RvY_00504-2 [Ramazzottius varieornatus]|uniref:Alpha-1,6-mannosyl-glycoprotein 2-beta-N-acetylglucosaminyltransferase n=1 Tax=Ramazzottius varieornatus TaxID=947166 RepID=A0A1D1UJA5_RAMVA|nr:hypothetical protein RvY_00504-2 [Ramazzottius varieornatus]
MTAFFHVRPSRRFIISAFVFTVFIWLFYLAVIARHNNQGHLMIPVDDGFHNVTLFNEADPMKDIKVLALRELVSERNLQAIKRLKDLSNIKVFRYVMVVQVHDRKTYIKAMLESLAGLRNIRDALVIFSHDVVDEEIDSLPFTVSKSFETVQIYFPHSLQLHPDRFPGTCPEDCPDRVGKAEATKRRCLFHDHPDTYGNYRTPRLTQVKHHWWWKVRKTFRASKSYIDDSGRRNMSLKKKFSNFPTSF